MNVASLSAENILLAPGHVLRRATKDEIAHIKKTVEELLGSGFQALSRYRLWESVLVQNGQRQALSEEQWRYYVLAYQGNNMILGDIEAAATLAQAELELGFTISYEMGGTGLLFHPSRLFHVLENAKYDHTFFVNVSKSSIQEITNIFAQFQQAGNGLINVKHFTQRLAELKELPNYSPLKISPS